MNETPLVRMADILLPQPVQQGAAWGAWSIAALLLALLLVLWWRRWRQPLRRLYRALKRGRVSPRAAADRLAGLIPDDAALRGELDRLRFQRQSPDATTVERLIRQVSDGG